MLQTVLVELQVQTKVVVHFFNLPIILEKSHFVMEESTINLIMSTPESQLVTCEAKWRFHGKPPCMMNQSLAVMLTSSQHFWQLPLCAK